MPIYAYRCSKCGFQKDYLQKISDPVLTDCPECSEATFVKQLTAPGFQLKGSGWYATDFKSGSKPAESNAAAQSDKPAAQSDKPAEDSAAAHTCGSGACASCS